MGIQIGTPATEIKLGTRKEMPSASDKGGMTKTRFTLLPEISPSPSCLPPKGKKRQIHNVSFLDTENRATEDSNL